MPKSAIPTRAAIHERLLSLRAFTGWDGKTRYTIVEIKPYVAPGNSPKVKGRMAVWLSSPNAKRKLIIFVDLVLAAIRYIKEPAKRGRYSTIASTNFASWASGIPAYRAFPHIYDHAGIYLVLARIILDLPEDWIEPPGVCEAAMASAVDRPNIKTIDGLLLDTLYAFVDGVHDSDPDDFPARAVTALQRNFGSRKRHDLREEWIADVRDLSDRVNADPYSAYIVDAPLVWFALLYLNALAWMGKIRASAVATIVDRLEDAHEAGRLRLLMRRPDRVTAMVVGADEVEMMRMARLLHSRRFH